MAIPVLNPIESYVGTPAQIELAGRLARASAHFEQTMPGKSRQCLRKNRTCAPVLGTTLYPLSYTGEATHDGQDVDHLRLGPPRSNAVDLVSVLLAWPSLGERQVAGRPSLDILATPNRA
jgi:hypothetical protein